jgi:hypothetical protein
LLTLLRALLEQLTQRFENGGVICCKGFQEPPQHCDVPDYAMARMHLSGNNCMSVMNRPEKACKPIHRNLVLPTEHEALATLTCMVDNAVNARFLEMERSAQCRWTNHVPLSREKEHTHSEERGRNLVSPMKLEWSLQHSKSNSQSVLASLPTYIKTTSRNGHTPCSCHPQIRKIWWVFTRASLLVGIKLVKHHTACDKQAASQLISLQIRAFHTALFKISMTLEGKCGFSLSQSITIRTAVDFKASPAFRLFLDDFTSYSGNGSCSYFQIKNDVQYERRVTRVQKQLLALIREGKISPLDVNQYGETLLGVCN